MLLHIQADAAGTAAERVAFNSNPTFANPASSFAAAIQVYSITNFSGTIAWLRSVYIREGANTAGTTTNAAGLYIEEPASGTTKYAMYVASGLSSFQADIFAATGIRIGVDAAANEIDDAAQGVVSTALFIGNAQITVASDMRIKRDIHDWDGDALALINKMHVVDFLWDDPQDSTPWGKNERGRYVGMLAQETAKIAPWIINAQGGRNCSLCQTGQLCVEHPQPWQVEYNHLVPTLVKAFQQVSFTLDNHTDEIADLKRRLAVLEMGRVA